MSSYYSSDDDIDIRVRHRGHSPSPANPVRYVQAPPRPRSYFGPPAGPSYLVPERHTTVVSRSRSRERSRSRDRRASPPVVHPPAPVIINNRIYNEHSDDEDNRRLQLVRPSRRHHSRSRASSSSSSSSSSRSRSRSRSHSKSGNYMTREAWEAEQARLELERMRLTTSRETDERRLAKQYREEAELQRAQRELDDIKGRDARSKDERRIREELELKRHKEESAAAAERRRIEEEAAQAIERYRTKELERLSKEKKSQSEKEKEAADAIERYKQKELERIAKERKLKEEKEKEAAEAIERYKAKEAERIANERREKEERDREYQRRLQEDLAKSGLDEDAIAAILKKEKIKKSAAQPVVDPAAVQMGAPIARPTYTRMARRHLSMETLQTFRVDFDLDMDPDYILIKRWVPEWEQDQLWKHTKYIREKRGKMLMIEEKKHSRLEPEFEWVRKKERKRSKSPGLLMYLAGARPS